MSSAKATVAVVTGSAGLVGSETTRLFAERGWTVVGVDNDMRARFFGRHASTAANRARLETEFPAYRHCDIDLRDRDAIQHLFAEWSASIGAIVHAAAQPSHDWAASDPAMDFNINAVGTMHLLESARRYAADAPFVFVSTNKVYGDTPNRLPLVEGETRYTLDASHPFAERGIDESMRIDQCLHSLFGVSKTAADIAVQEYGRYFGMPTACFRCGCLTGAAHAAVETHGFLAYLVRACSEVRHYRIYGYKAKQVRDILHARDLAQAFWSFVSAPRCGEVYNLGGGIYSNCSVLEAIRLTEDAVGRHLDWVYEETPRIGDHMWWIGDLTKFQSHFPDWQVRFDVPAIVDELARNACERV